MELILTRIPLAQGTQRELRGHSTVIQVTGSLVPAMQLVKSKEQLSIGHTLDLLQVAHVRKSTYCLYCCESNPM